MMLVFVIASLLLSLIRTDPGAVGSVTDAVRRAAEAYLTEHFPADAHRLDVRVERLSPGLSLDGPIQLSFTSSAEIPKGKLQTSLYTGGDKVGWALLYVAHYDSVAVAGVRLTKGAEVGASDLSFAWMETTRFSGDPLRPSDLRSLTSGGTVFAARLIQEDRALRTSDLRGAFAAETGSPILVRYMRGPVTLKLTCTARESGAAGETIRAYYAETGAMYRVRLTGPGTAVWLATLNTTSK